MGLSRRQADAIVALAHDPAALRELVNTLIVDDDNNVPDGTFYGYVECSGCGCPCDTLDDGSHAQLVLEGWRWTDETFTAARCPGCNDDQASGIRPSSAPDE